MLGDNEAFATVAVRDLEVARKFYEGKLELKETGSEGSELIAYRSGNSSLLVYRSQYAGTNKATAVTWTVSGVEETVKALRARGVAFEHYDLPDTTREGDIHIAGDVKVAWFKDPDGNIHSVVNR
ncbi:MAG: VOC family protein [Gemmatimonadaceae bacterium]